MNYPDYLDNLQWVMGPSQIVPVIMSNRHRFHRTRRGYDPLTGVYHLYHDWSADEPLSHSVSLAVAALTGLDPTTGDPLTDVVETDALDRLFNEHKRSGSQWDRVRITYEQCAVTIYRDGHIIVRPPDAS